MRVEGADHAVDGAIDHGGAIGRLDVIAFDDAQDLGEDIEPFVGIGVFFCANDWGIVAPIAKPSPSTAMKPIP